MLYRLMELMLNLSTHIVALNIRNPPSELGTKRSLRVFLSAGFHPHPTTETYTQKNNKHKSVL